MVVSALQSSGINNYLDVLNQEQLEAVTAERQNMLVVAGAGTGKTRVLVSRIAYLIDTLRVNPTSILAVTFTNKAAKEMRERLAGLIGEHQSRKIWAYTFHTASSHILRNFADSVGLTRDFCIIDTADQVNIVKQVMQDLNLGKEVVVRGKKYTPKNYLSAIMAEKSQGHRPELVSGASPIPYLYDVYCLYQSRCDQGNLVDFEELLLRTCELIENNEKARHYLHMRFKEILVDEFQDTNSLQYRWLKLISGHDPYTKDASEVPANVTIVGDDDQSIYGWRGAVIANMQYFLTDFAPVKMLKLIRNYRSTQQILNNANSVIKNNKNHLIEKALITDKNDGQPVKIVESCDNLEEADNVAMIIRKLRDNVGYNLNDIAVLYRTNAQSRVIEKALVESNINYSIYGGARFYDREEIKNALAYLRLIVNVDDDVSFRRIVNVPSRKIGKSTLSKIEAIKTEFGTSMYAACSLFLKKNKSVGLKRFIEIIEKFRGQLDLETSVDEKTAGNFLYDLLTESGLLQYYKDVDERENNGENSNNRSSNLDELINDISSQDYSESIDPEIDENVNSEDAQEDIQEVASNLKEFFQIFLNSAALQPSSEILACEEHHAVNLMTIHCAKGLEFDCVIIVGFEKNLLPMIRNNFIDESKYEELLEEERRLAYVAMTRAKKVLFVCYADCRYTYNGPIFTGISEFIDEFDDKSVDDSLSFLG